MKIGFFDSGIGGLTVLHEALKVLPHEDYIYFSDGDNAPYGVRPKEEVRQLVFNAIDFIAKQGVEAIVVACNTATSVAIDDLRKKYDFPIIGMEPAVKPAVAVAAGKRVLVFATNLTLKLEKFQHLVAKVDTQNLVDYLPLQELVGHAENFEFNEKIILPYLQEKLKGIDFEKYGAVVLGCTHFPFFKNILRKLLPAHVQIMDGNLGTVQNLKNKIASHSTKSKGTVLFFRSGKSCAPDKFEQYLDFLANSLG